MLAAVQQRYILSLGFASSESGHGLLPAPYVECLGDVRLQDHVMC